MTDPTDDRERVRNLLKDQELMSSYWENGHDHLWRRSWAKMRETIGGWVLGILLSGAASALIVLAVQRGWFK